VGFIQGVVIFFVVTWLGLTRGYPPTVGSHDDGRSFCGDLLWIPGGTSFWLLLGPGPSPPSSASNRMRHSRSGSRRPSREVADVTLRAVLIPRAGGASISSRSTDALSAVSAPGFH